MFLQLDSITSTHPSFGPPKLPNGEPMDLLSVESIGNYMIARFIGAKPVEGPGTEQYLLDLYCNDQGQEVYRVKANVFHPPPPPPTFIERLRQSLRYLFQHQQQHSR